MACGQPQLTRAASHCSSPASPKPCADFCWATCLSHSRQPEGKGKENAAFQPRKRIQLSHFQRISTESAVQKAVRDHLQFSERSKDDPGQKAQPGTFDVASVLRDLAGHVDKLPVIPNGTTLHLLKKRSMQVRETLQW